MRNVIDSETRRSIRLNLWDAISEISDLDFQRKTWDQIDSPHFTHVEFCECFFDCLPNGVLAAAEYGAISEEEAKVLTPLFDAIEAHKSPTESDYDDAAILRDPNWHEVVRIAESCRRSLVSLVDSEEANRLSRARNQACLEKLNACQP